MTRKTKDTKVRLNIVLDERSRENLTELQMKTSADSLSETIRRALQLYEYIFDKTEDGAEFILKEKDGEQYKIPMY